VLFGFVGGDNARSYNTMSFAARRSAVLNQYAGWFGPEAMNAINFFDTNWSDEMWTRGCPVGIPSLGTLLSYGPVIREPVGQIHWAGTETSTYWNGYMDGAVRSGERAAAEVLAGLRFGTPSAPKTKHKSTPKPKPKRTGTSPSFTG
jgi:monoamine oxidase